MIRPVRRQALGHLPYKGGDTVPRGTDPENLGYNIAAASKGENATVILLEHGRSRAGESNLPSMPALGISITAGTKEAAR